MFFLIPQSGNASSLVLIDHEKLKRLTMTFLWSYTLLEMEVLTCNQLEMQDGDTLEVHAEQIGGC